MIASLLFYVVCCVATEDHNAFDMKWFPYDTHGEFFIHPFFSLLVCIVAIGVLLLPCLVLMNLELYQQHKQQQQQQQCEITK
ncbi:hypothetical protein KM1_090370 [Entamoeba histolytica HM-3:IMSS]|uniref:Uncharacterized protein n=3 Tax=Entamoeba TaxID=5758 RepID=K2GTT8_ENTNP|nr:hypothetical protein ENU1_204980 [Entamoeba nuttalli P19]EKE37217.1 hypothetical protein ENU1_204980 [Entamoeba nuttalli P19]EMS12304.1 hypothetical protein KM1_090370 [Entamoeba histolytica HM-3:IMSS]|eukprot:XP_008860449.1 hypothetical protein ENU1_204980 [Entamoeba nuttalli P19]